MITWKNEIFVEIERQTSKLGNHYDLNHKANAEDWKVTDENVRKIHNIVSRIRKQQRETAEQQAESDTEQKFEALEHSKMTIGSISTSDSSNFGNRLW